MRAQTHFLTQPFYDHHAPLTISLRETLLGQLLNTKGWSGGPRCTACEPLRLHRSISDPSDPPLITANASAFRSSTRGPEIAKKASGGLLERRFVVDCWLGEYELVESAIEQVTNQALGRLGGPPRPLQARREAGHEDPADPGRVPAEAGCFIDQETAAVAGEPEHVVGGGVLRELSEPALGAQASA